MGSECTSCNCCSSSGTACTGKCECTSCKVCLNCLVLLLCALYPWLRWGKGTTYVLTPCSALSLFTHLHCRLPPIWPIPDPASHCYRTSRGAVSYLSRLWNAHNWDGWMLGSVEKRAWGFFDGTIDNRLTSTSCLFLWFSSEPGAIYYIYARYIMTHLLRNTYLGTFLSHWDWMRTAEPLETHRPLAYVWPPCLFTCAGCRRLKFVSCLTASSRCVSIVNRII